MNSIPIPPPSLPSPMETLIDHYSNGEAILKSSIDYVAKTVLMAFETHETPSFILPRQELSFNSLAATVEENEVEADFPSSSYNSILFYLMTAWQECKNAGYVAEYPIMDSTNYKETPYFITDLGYDTLGNFHQERDTPPPEHLNTSDKAHNRTYTHERR